jgi:hypothetical protein
MLFCLAVQKDTLENGYVKSIMKVWESSPGEFLSSIQESSCYEFQLIAYTKICMDLDTKLTSLTAAYKTNYGKNWYSFNANAIADIVSLFLKYDSAVIDIHLISEIFGFSFKIFPVVKKEINIVPVTITDLNSNSSGNYENEISIPVPSSSSVSSSVNVSVPSSINVSVPINEKAELLSLIEQIDETKSELRHRPEKKDRSKKVMKKKE